MPAVSTLERSFGGGEVTPEFWGRIDDVKFQTGLGLEQNFYSLPHGPAANRAGTVFVRAVKAAANRTRVLPFAYSTTQTIVIELGDKYARFHTQGASLLTPAATAYNGATAYAVGDLQTTAGIVYYCIAASTGNAAPNASFWYAIGAAGSPYEIPTPFSSADVFDIHYVQSADVLTLAHPGYAPVELRRLGATTWTLSAIAFASAMIAPAGLTASPTTTGGSTTSDSYVVTSLASDGVDESVVSTAASALNNLFSIGAYNTITWSAASGAARYNVYKLSGGLYGFIGQTTNLSIIDNNITPDISRTPPQNNNPFSGAGNYPAAVSYYEQRRCFAGTLSLPQTLWATKSGTEKNLNYSIPSRDDDSISFRIAAREANTIRHIVPLSNMVLLTSSAEWRVTSINTDALTPTSVSVKPQSYVGASNVQPSIVNNNLIYVAARGGHVREMAYSYTANGYVTGDTSLRAPHLFDGYDIVDQAYAKSPYPILWFVSTSGMLLSLTYVPEQQIGAWARHTTGDATGDVFESVAVVAEGNEDAVYVVVKRTINAATVRYVERFASRRFATQADAFFVDAGASYSGAPITTVNSGISHLEGMTVAILADGAVHPPKVVTGGSITLDQAASKIQIGLPIAGLLRLLPAFFQDGPALGQTRQKNVDQAYLRVYNSGGFSVGVDLTRMVPAKLRTTESYGTPVALRTGVVPLKALPGWDDGAELYVQQSDPLPLTVVSVAMDLALGG